MVKYYYKSLRNQQLKEVPEYQRGCWIHAEAPSEKELEDLITRFKLTAGHLQDALDEDEMPRLEKEGDQSYIFVRFAHKEAGELTTAPLLFIFGKEILITVSQVRPPFLDKLLTGKLDLATTQRARLMLQILHQIVEQYDVLITKTSKQIKNIRSRLRGHEISNQDFIDFVMIEDELNEFLSTLLPANAIFRRLLRGNYIDLFEEDQDIIEDLLLGNEQSIEACKSNVKSIVNIREAYSSISSNTLNRTMKVLTLATVGIALPNMFYGLYGMNVALPFQHQTWAFSAVFSFTIVLTALVFIFARRKRIF